MKSLHIKAILIQTLLLTYATLAPAQTTDPILTLNTEMHTANINRISTDNRGRYLLTASFDKTSKLWDIATGALLRTFRPPIGAGDEGMLYAGALSPDGRIVAVGGWTGYDWFSEHSIYLFDAATGAMLRRLSALPNVIQDLEFSFDGRYLAAALASSGIRIWRTTDYVLAKTDSDYDGRIDNLAFDAGGRLATVCRDGYLRLYDNNFNLLKKVATKGGKEPYSLAFSLDGRLLAVGYNDSPTVQVLDATTLALRYAPDVSGANTVNDRLEMVAFSTDGNYLAAGCYYKLFQDGQWWRQVRIWQQAGKGAYTDCKAGGNAILDIKPLHDGQFVFGGSQDWGLLDPSTFRRSHYAAAEINDYSANDRSHFRLGPEGKEVGATPFLRSPLQFSVPTRRFTQSASSHPSSVTERNSFIVSDWLANTAPKLNGKNFSFLKKYERCLSADIATGGQSIVLGADWNIYCSDAGGQKRWSPPVQSAAYCVNIDDYNLVVAAALGDGTIRWYRLTDGQLLLTLFLHPDNRRWVLWTPSGYYDAAPGAEDLLGWHVNNGPDKAASYYPVSKFRDTYYRPDVIDLILETLDETEALRQANQKAGLGGSVAPRTITNQLPPTVRILSPAPNAEVSSTQITIGYSVESPNDEPVTGIRLQVDGRPIATERGFQPGQKSTITIPATDCAVSVIAENRFGASDPATVRLRWSGTTSAVNAGVDVRPVLYVLSIGVSQYTHAEVKDLDFAAKDARDFAAALAKQKGLLYRDVQQKVLTDAEATKDNILDGLDWLQRTTTSRDVAMLFFAGHGVDDNAQNFFFLPVGADPNALRRTGVAHGDVQSTVASVPGKIVVFMDACHSGSLMKPINPNRRGLPPDVIKIVNELISAENGGIVFCSATSRQYALEDKAWNNGAFTKAVVEGLSGKAKTPGSDKITLKTLDAYVAERVKELTKGEQSPTTVYSVDVPDFPIGIVK